MNAAYLKRQWCERRGEFEWISVKKLSKECEEAEFSLFRVGTDGEEKFSRREGALHFLLGGLPVTPSPLLMNREDLLWATFAGTQGGDLRGIIKNNRNTRPAICEVKRELSLGTKETEKAIFQAGFGLYEFLCDEVGYNQDTRFLNEARFIPNEFQLPSERRIEEATILLVANRIRKKFKEQISINSRDITNYAIKKSTVSKRKKKREKKIPELLSKISSLNIHAVEVKRYLLDDNRGSFYLSFEEKDVKSIKL